MVRSGHIVSAGRLKPSWFTLWRKVSEDRFVSVVKPAARAVTRKAVFGEQQEPRPGKSLQQHANLLDEKMGVTKEKGSTTDSCDSANLVYDVDPQASGIVLFAKSHTVKAYLQSQWHRRAPASAW